MIKKYFNYLKNFIFEPKFRFDLLESKGLLNKVDDVTFLKKKYKLTFGKELNLEQPVTFNEKLQWLKINDRNPLYTRIVDKYEVKEYIAELLGEEYVIPTLGVWENFDEIDFDKLPNQFVLKCTHDSGGLIICKDKTKLNRKEAKEKIERSLKKNFYYSGREWPYKDIKPRIIAEQYLDDNGYVPADYKITCFNGEPYKVMVCLDRDKDTPTRFYSFDWEWNLLRHNKWGKLAKDNSVCEKPKNLKQMYEIAKILSKDFPFVRVDLYEVKNQIYFGELTFFPDSGFDKNIDPEMDKLYGSMLQLNI